MLLDDIRTRLKAAMKNQRTVEKEILRVALGELQTIEARGEAIDDALVLRVVKKLLKSNRETLDATTATADRAALEEEIVVLESLVPKSMSVDDIAAALAPVADQIRAAGNDGQATGIAMRHLKGAGIAADGKDVAEATKRLRSATPS